MNGQTIKDSKLIRDNYDTIIEKENLYIVEDKVKHFIYLKDKINEELSELQETAFNDINEFADVIETLYAMAKFQGISIEDIELARKEKLVDKGGFDKGLILKLS